MHYAAKAYGRIAQQTASPRDLEAQLLLRAAARLQTIHDDWEGQKSALDNALLYNRNAPTQEGLRSLISINKQIAADSGDRT